MPRDPESSESAEVVKLNMTPMIDVVFQLIVFFLCSMRFKSFDELIQLKLPTNRGVAPTSAPCPPVPKLTVALRRHGGGDTILKVGGRTLGSLAPATRAAVLGEMRSLADATMARCGGVNAATAIGLAGEIDGGPEVPLGDILRAIDVFRSAEFQTLTFVGTAEPLAAK